jgi:hypothetical protein
MRSKEEVDWVKALFSEGLNHCQIARRTSIPRGTVRDWLSGKEPRRARRLRNGCPACGHDTHDPSQLPPAEYAYLLGMYLGDGMISAGRRSVYRLRIFLDMKYPGIIAECAAAIRAVMPDNAVHVQYYVGGGQCAQVACYSKAWPCFIPQHGSGMKHHRKIELTRWQLDIAERYPTALIRGLIHSDGCRVLNKSMGRVYVRYMFSNASADIRGIFCRACDQLGIAWRQPRERTISVARRKSVALLDTFVGPKT